MQLRPRYGSPAVLRFDPAPDDPSVPLLRQRRRLADRLARLDGGEWDAPSRCEAWSCRDVVSHLVTADRFWAASIGAGRAGEPTRLLTGFDPVTTPPQLLAGAAPVPDDELLESLVAATEAMAGALDGIDRAEWALPAETPLGHLALSAVAMHALWDGWVHERDALLPLGLETDEEPDEVAACLRYAVGIGPAHLATDGSGRTGRFAVRAERPDLVLVVEAAPDVVVRDGVPPDGCAVVEGRAVDLVEAFSLRGDAPVLAGPDGWLVDGVRMLFDQAR